MTRNRSLIGIARSSAAVQTILGNRYGATKRFDGFTTATPAYFLFENPSNSGVVVLLQTRVLKTLDSGLSTFSVLWDYDVSSATKTAIPSYNQHNGVNDTSNAEISVLNSVTTASVGAWSITGAATIDDEGYEREGDFIPTSGVGSNTSGGVSPDAGTRIYMPGTGFLSKAVSESPGNSIIWGYTWFEIPVADFNLL